MDFDEIRRHTIVALFSDDALLEGLVLKGGNAISLIYGFGNRASLDLDWLIGRTLFALGCLTPLTSFAM